MDAETVDIEILRSDLMNFRSKWLLNNKDLSEMWGIPKPTLQGIITVGKKRTVRFETAKKIYDGMRNYNPRTCTHRRIRKAEAAKVFLQMKERHHLSWDEVAEITGALKSTLWDVVTPTSQTQYICISDLRSFLQRYHEWEVERSRILIREGVA